MEYFDIEKLGFWIPVGFFVVIFLQCVMMSFFNEKINITNALLRNMCESLSEMNGALDRIEDGMYRGPTIDRDFYAEHGGG